MVNYVNKYEEYKEHIKILKKVTLEETGFFKEINDKILMTLKRNNIVNVGELLERDYYKINGNVDVLYQISGIRNLLSYIYLGENLPYIGVLNKEITCREVIKDIFLKFGLSEDFLIHACTFYFYSGETVISYLYRVLHYPNNMNVFDVEDLKKIKIIVDWYHRLSNYQANKTIDETNENLNILYSELDILQNKQKEINAAIKKVKDDITNTEKARSRLLKRPKF